MWFFREIIKKREDFEYRIALLKKDIHDFVNYIQYERGLVTLIRKKLRLPKSIPNSIFSITRIILMRIREIYKKGFKLYPSDFPLWEEYIKYLQQYNSPAEISTLFQKILMVVRVKLCNQLFSSLKLLFAFSFKIALRGQSWCMESSHSLGIHWKLWRATCKRPTESCYSTSFGIITIA